MKEKHYNHQKPFNCLKILQLKRSSTSTDWFKGCSDLFVPKRGYNSEYCCKCRAIICTGKFISVPNTKIGMNYYEL
eukprot:1266411-Ditylum_brightwellii.AAC.1